MAGEITLSTPERPTVLSKILEARRFIFIGLIIVLLLCAITLIGASDTDPAKIIASFLATTLAVATPLTLGALSGIFCERAGVVNIAIEGMMLGACFFGFIGASWFKSQGVPDQAALWLGVVVAMFTGFLFAALHAVLSIRFKVNQIISGTVINILAVGLTGYLNRQLFFQQGAAQLQSAGTLDRMPIPLLSDLPLIGGIFNQPPITYLALILVIVTQFVLFRTVWGLRTRSVGEHPRAADTRSWPGLCPFGRPVHESPAPSCRAAAAWRQRCLALRSRAGKSRKKRCDFSRSQPAAPPGSR